MAFWIEVRWPMITGDRLDLLYFHKGQYHRAQQMCEGDEVLYYETLKRDRAPKCECSECSRRTECAKLRGSQTIFAHVIVQGKLERRPTEEVRTCGGYKFDRMRRVEVVLPKNENMERPGVKLPRVREVIGNRPMFGMQIPEDEFRRLAAELKQAVERAAGADTSCPQ